jgi:hypothetical protein
MKLRAMAIPWLLVAILAAGACEQGGETAVDEARIDERLGSLNVVNAADEPVTVYLDGEEVYSVPPGTAYTFRNLPTREVSIYGVGRVTERHYGLPKLTIEAGGEYEWTIRQ